MAEEVCQICGKEFQSERGRRFCSETCKAENMKRRNKEEYWKRKNAFSPRKCALCGKEYQPTHGNQVFCSRKCAGNYDRRKVIQGKRSGLCEMVGIRITKEIPVYPELRPKVGRIYQAEVNRSNPERAFYCIQDIAGKRIIVRNDECTEISRKEE